METKLNNWSEPDHGREELGSSPSQKSRFVRAAPETPLRKKEIWVNPELTNQDETANLDSQEPPTLYYLGRVVGLPQLIQIYVDKRDGGLKHWAVLEERDYEVMEQLYEIEEDTLDSFPMADLNFRVTVFTEEGPSISNKANKIYDAR